MLRAIRPLLASIGTVTIVIAILVGGRATGLPQERYLIIHSDDAGYSSAVNEATIDGFERGVVSSASIMTVCQGFDEFARYAVAHPKYDYGVHLVLTAEYNHVRWGPILGKDVPSLVQPDGTFWQTSEQVAEHAKKEDVRSELRAQIYRAMDRNIPISHLDHHMWVLLQRPDLLQVYCDLSIEFQLPIRLHRTHAPKECGKLLQNDEEYAALIRPAAAAGNPLFDFIDANNYDVPADQKRAYFLSELRRLPPGVSEFVIHCSVNRPGMLLPHAADRRAADARVFTSLEIQDEIRRLGIQVINWKEFVKWYRRGKFG